MRLSWEKEKKLWTITTIGDMLKNEVYLGKTIWNKTRQAAVGSNRQIKNDRSEWTIIEGTHEPLAERRGNADKRTDDAHKGAGDGIGRSVIA